MACKSNGGMEPTYFWEEYAARKRRTDVRPMCNCRAQLSGDLRFADASTEQLPHRGFVMYYRRRSAKSLTLLPRVIQPRPHSLTQDLAFELSILRFSAICA